MPPNSQKILCKKGAIPNFRPVVSKTLITKTNLIIVDTIDLVSNYYKMLYLFLLAQKFNSCKLG